MKPEILCPDCDMPVDYGTIETERGDGGREATWIGACGNCDWSGRSVACHCSPGEIMRVARAEIQHGCEMAACDA